MSSLARPLSKGWPLPVTAEPTLEPGDKLATKLVRRMDFEMDDIQQVVLPGNTLVGSLRVQQKKKKVHVIHRQQINRVNFSARIWDSTMPRMVIKKANSTVSEVEPQTDTGANITATNNLQAIFDFRPYPTPEVVQTFMDSESAPSNEIAALGYGYMKIISDEGEVTPWPVIYTPQSNGTVLSPDNYCYSVPAMDVVRITMTMSLKRGSMIFYNTEGNRIVGFTLGRTNNGEWMLRNKVLKDTQSMPLEIKKVLLPRRKVVVHRAQCTSQSKMLEVPIINASVNPNPKYATEGASGMDLYASISQPVVIGPHQWVLVPTGV